MKILIFAKNWLGDALFQFPAIEILKKHYPGAELVCAAPARCRDLFLSHPDIERFLVFDEKSEHRNWWKRWRFIQQIRKENFDSVYLFHRSRTRSLIALLAGIPLRIGYGRGRGRLLTTAVAEPAQPLHQVDFFLELLRGAGLTDVPQDVPYRLPVSFESRMAASALLSSHKVSSRNYICFHLGANWEPKRWPVGHFAKLADMISQKHHLPVVVTGSPGDASLIRELQMQVTNASIISFVGRTSLQELAAIFEEALCLVTGDSGPMHIASAVGCPVLALFGPTDPVRTGPRGVGEKEVLTFVPPGHNVPWTGNELPAGGWLEQISPDEVFQALGRRAWLSRRHEESAAAGPQSESGQEETSDNVKEILLVTLSNIGDVVLTTPVIMVLRERFPQAKLTVVAGPRARGILEGSHLIDRLVIYDKKAGWKSQIAFWWSLQGIRYDLVVDLRNTAIPFLIHARRRSPLFRRFQETGMRDRHLEVLMQMGIRPEFRKPFDFYSAAEEANLMAKLKDAGVRQSRDWIVIAPVAASELKTWPLERFQQLMKRLLVEFSGEILLIGNERERDQADQLSRLAPGRVFNIAGMTTLREAAALIHRSGLLIANDSALMHLGFELNRPVVALFGPTDPSRYGRKGPRFRILRSPSLPLLRGKTVHRGDRDYFFEGLTPEIVFDACREIYHETISRPSRPVSH